MSKIIEAKIMKKVNKKDGKTYNNLMLVYDIYQEDVLIKTISVPLNYSFIKKWSPKQYEMFKLLEKNIPLFEPSPDSIVNQYFKDIPNNLEKNEDNE